jgi:hypothetical protein
MEPPQSFAGIPFGASLESLEQQHQVRDCFAVAADSSFACMKDLNLTGNVNVVITLSGNEPDRKFSRAWFNFDPAQYDLIRGAFTEKYGEPTKKLTSPSQNAFGARFENEAVVWEWGALFANVVKYQNKITEGMAFIGPHERDKSEEAKREAAGKL